jgi:predicted Zn-ribbon and HTH transcriptional regulator
MECDSVEEQQGEATASVVQPAGRIGFREAVVPLERLAVGGSDYLLRTPRLRSLLASSTPLEHSFRGKEGDTTMAETTDVEVISSNEVTANNRKQVLKRLGEDLTLIPPACKKSGRPIHTVEQKGQYTAAKRRKHALQKRDNETNEGARGTLDLFCRANGRRAIEVRKKAEEESFRMRYDLTAAQAHEGLETLMKVVKSAKSMQGNLKSSLEGGDDPHCHQSSPFYKDPTGRELHTDGGRQQRSRPQI